MGLHLLQKLLRILRWQQQSINPSVRSFQVRGTPLQHRLHAHEASPFPASPSSYQPQRQQMPLLLRKSLLPPPHPTKTRPSPQASLQDKETGFYPFRSPIRMLDP